MKRLRAAALVAIGLCPGPLKRLLYRSVFGYRIDRRAAIGFAFLDCRALTVGPNTTIGHGVVFTRCGEVSIGSDVRIGPLNLFRGGDRIALADFVTILRLNVFNAIPDHECEGTPDSSLDLGRGAVVTAEHRLDFTDRISVGRSTILAGRGTTLWTHNRRRSTPVSIGAHCYIGSETRMAPGAAIPDCCIVGMGSVVVRQFEDTYSLIAGVPAVRKRALHERDYDTFLEPTRGSIPKDGYQPPPRPAAPYAPRPAGVAEDFD